MGRHLLVYLPVYIAQALVGFGGVVVFTRLLSAEDYGRYALLLAAVGLAQAGLFTWLNAGVARHHARAERKHRLGAHLSTTLLLGASLSVLVGGSLALIVFLSPLSAPLKTAALAACALLAVRGLLDVVQETRRAAGEAVWFAALETAALAGGFAAAVLIVIHTDLGAAGAIWGLALAAAIALAAGLPPLLRRTRPDRAAKIRTRTLFAFGAPVTASLIFEQVLSVGDRFLIAAMLGEAPTGAYAAGYGVADRSIDIVFIWLGMTAAPLTVIALEKSGADAARAIARDAARLMGLIALPAAVGLAMVADPLARLLIAEELAGDAAAIMPLVAAGALVNGVMVYFFHKGFTLGRRTGEMALLMALGAGLNIALNLVLIPAMGLTGAALATLIAYAAAAAASAVRARAAFRLDTPWADWLRCAGAAGAMAAGLSLIPQPERPLAALAVMIPAGIALYAGAALWLDAAGCRRLARRWIGDRNLRLSPEARS